MPWAGMRMERVYRRRDGPAEIFVLHDRAPEFLKFILLFLCSLSFVLTRFVVGVSWCSWREGWREAIVAKITPRGSGSGHSGHLPRGRDHTATWRKSATWRMYS